MCMSKEKENIGLVLRLWFLEFKDSKEWDLLLIGEVFIFYSGGILKIFEKIFYGGEVFFICFVEIGKEEIELIFLELGLVNLFVKMVRLGDFLVVLYGVNSGEVVLVKLLGVIN